MYPNNKVDSSVILYHILTRKLVFGEVKFDRPPNCGFHQKEKGQRKSRFCYPVHKHTPTQKYLERHKHLEEKLDISTAQQIFVSFHRRRRLLFGSKERVSDSQALFLPPRKLHLSHLNGQKMLDT